jgi:DNA helicase-2/ATP-dependent DNA helicase PcrA
MTTKLKEIKGEDEDASYWAILTKEPQRLVDPRNMDAMRNFTQFVHSLTRYRNLPAGDALKQLLGALKVGDHFSELEYPDSDPLENLAALTKMAYRYGSIKEFLDFCRRITAASKKKSGVALGTIHSFKGLQASRVFVVQCSEGILPHSKSNDLASERNCFFVGASRAERELTITYSGVPSVFLAPFIKKEKADEPVQA